MVEEGSSCDQYNNRRFKVNQPPPESANDITLFAYSRDESSTTLECYIGSSLYGDTSGGLIYNLLYKAAGAPTFTSIYSYQGSGAQPTESPFIIKKYCPLNAYIFISTKMF